MKFASATVLAFASIISALPNWDEIENFKENFETDVHNAVHSYKVPNLGVWSYATLHRDQIDQTCNKLSASDCFKNLLCHMDDGKCQAINLIELHHKAEEICEKYKNPSACINAPDGKFLGNVQVCQWDDYKCKTETLKNY